MASLQALLPGGVAAGDVLGASGQTAAWMVGAARKKAAPWFLPIHRRWNEYRVLSLPSTVLGGASAGGRHCSGRVRAHRRRDGKPYGDLLDPGWRGGSLYGRRGGYHAAWCLLPLKGRGGILHDMAS